MIKLATTCVVCHKETEPDQLVVFGEDAVCGDCKDDYVQCLKEGLEPTFDSGFWRHNRYIYCERDADLTPRCICCNAEAELSRPVSYVDGEPFRLRIQSAAKGAINLGYCRRCRKKLDRYAVFATVYGAAFVFSFLGPMVLSWTNSTALNLVFLVSLAVALICWIIRLLLMPEPTALFQYKSKLIRVSGAGPDFRGSVREIPLTRLHEQRD